MLAQVSAVLSLVGLIVFRKPITHRPVSYTLFWVTVAGAVLYLPTIGLFYGVNEWFGVSPRTFAFIDTTISAPLGQLSMVPMLALIARRAPRGAEATMFADHGLADEPRAVGERAGRRATSTRSSASPSRITRTSGRLMIASR